LDECNVSIEIHVYCMILATAKEHKRTHYSCKRCIVIIIFWLQLKNTELTTTVKDA